MDQQIRDLFPAARTFTYLNTAAMAPLPTVTVDAVTSQMNDVARNGASNVGEWLETKQRVREQAASMLKANASDVAFTRNTSDGLCAVASGHNWRRGDNIVSFEGEFPANYYPWKKLADERGVELRLCPEREGRIDAGELCDMIDGHTRLVSVSAVQYCSGFRLDLERIGQAARKRDSLFCVDIIQAFGAVPFDLPAQYIDIASGASYKWLCAPEGCGIFYINERARERVKPLSRGWMSVANAWDFNDRNQPEVTEARAWETGMGGSALFYGLEQSLRLLCQAGIEKISAYLAELTDFLCEIIPSNRYQILSARSSGEKSQIVSIKPINGASCDEVVDQLSRENIKVSTRCGKIRIAPHFFNNFADIEKFVECLP